MFRFVLILNLTIVVYDLIQNNNLTFVLFLDIGLLLLGTFIYAYLETELEKRNKWKSKSDSHPTNTGRGKTS